MPAGLIEHQHGVGAGRDALGDFDQMQVHRVGVALGQDERRALAVLGRDRAEDVGRSGSLIFGSAWTRAALGPTAGDLVLLADARLVGEPDLYGAGLDVPKNITILPLPAKCPELNPTENVWQFLRDNWLSNRVFKGYDDIVAHCCDAWNKLVDQPWRIMSIGLRDWAHGF